jgi:alkylation response protein AidB-like acyl-CoA dehydrogenase/enoyl-CoA hydratase/carnithine racemase
MMNKVEVIKRDYLGVIIIKNPPYNILSTPVFLEIGQGLEDLKNDHHIKAVIITGQGLISYGADVTEIYGLAREGDLARIKQLLAAGRGIIDMIEDMGKPVIAAVDGYCIGAGNEIVMACSACLASDQAQLGQPEIKLGIMPGLGGTQRLPRRIGIKGALEMLLTGNLITARQALELGLVDGVVPQAKLISKTRAFAVDFLEKRMKKKTREPDPNKIDQIINSDSYRFLLGTKPRDAVHAVIKAVKQGLALPLPEALELENQIFCQLVVTPDAKEGLAAFIEKRPPQFPSLVKPGEREEAPRVEKAAETGPGTLMEGEVFSRPEFETLRDTVADFARKEIEPHIEQMEKEERILPEIIKKMGELGFFGVCFPEKYGGSNFGKTGYCILFEELARVHASTAVFAGAHLGLASSAIDLFGTEAQKQEYLVPITQGKAIGAFALTEAGAGSDAANIQTTAKKQGNKWIINGTKQFITNGDFANFLVVIAQTDKLSGTQGLCGFIVDTRWPGFSVGKLEKKLGIKAARTSELAFEDLEVPEENKLGEVGQGFKIFMNTLNGGRLGLAAGCLGASKEAFKLAFSYASQRVQFGKTLIEQEAIQFYFAEMRAKIYMMESAIYRAAAAADRGKDFRLEAAILKLTCSEMCSEIIDLALQIFGGYGYMEDYPIARMYRDARINRIFEGTNEIQKLMIFKEIFKSGGRL